MYGLKKATRGLPTRGQVSPESAAHLKEFRPFCFCQQRAGGRWRVSPPSAQATRSGGRRTARCARSRAVAARSRDRSERARAGRASERSAALLLSSRAAPRSQPLDQADVTSKTLNVEILVAGDGYHYPRMNNLVSVDYVGYLPDGARARPRLIRARARKARARARGARRPRTRAGLTPRESSPFALPRARAPPSRAPFLASRGAAGSLSLAGKVFDATYRATTAASFSSKLGTEMVIPGLDKAVSQLSVGERAKVTIGHELAYGKRGLRSSCRATSPLVFDLAASAVGARAPSPASSTRAAAAAVARQGEAPLGTARARAARARARATRRGSRSPRRRARARRPSRPRAPRGPRRAARGARARGRLARAHVARHARRARVEDVREARVVEQPQVPAHVPAARGGCERCSRSGRAPGGKPPARRTRVELASTSREESAGARRAPSSRASARVGRRARAERRRALGRAPPARARTSAIVGATHEQVG